jgi:hypothetical protein
MPNSKRKRSGGSRRKSSTKASSKGKRSKSTRKGAKKPSKTITSKTRKTSRSSAHKRKQIKTFELPKTRSKEIVSGPGHKINLGRNRHDIAYDEMTLTQLQIMARNRGIPFGGLPREKLIRKINIYK